MQIFTNRYFLLTKGRGKYIFSNMQYKAVVRLTISSLYFLGAVFVVEPFAFIMVHCQFCVTSQLKFTLIVVYTMK